MSGGSVEDRVIEIIDHMSCLRPGRTAHVDCDKPAISGTITE